MSAINVGDIYELDMVAMAEDLGTEPGDVEWDGTWNRSIIDIEDGAPRLVAYHVDYARYDGSGPDELADATDGHIIPWVGDDYEGICIVEVVDVADNGDVMVRDAESLFNENLVAQPGKGVSDIPLSADEFERYCTFDR